MGRTEITGLLDDLGRTGRVKIRWRPMAAKPREEVKLAFLALQCCETAMPLGGAVEIDCDGEGWTVTGTADRLNIEQDLWQGLNKRPDPRRITPALVQFALLPEVATTAGKRVRAETTSTRVVIRF